MEHLRVGAYLRDIKETGNAVLRGEIVCTCGNQCFSIYHSGRQTKGILSAFVAKKKGQLQVAAHCPACGRVMVLYDSARDGSRSKKKPSEEAKQIFALRDYSPEEWRITMLYNYYPEKCKPQGVYSNDFEMIFIEVSNDHTPKPIRIVEE